jgi:phosphotransferase system  glucose/maltose/N-acetylglucosamine-specific IIC component
MISVTDIVWTIVYILCCGGIWYLLNLLIDKTPYVNPQFKEFAKFVLMALAILLAIAILLNFMSGGRIFSGPILRP